MITSKDNDLIKQVSKLLGSAKFRKETGLFVAEGLRLSIDAFESGVSIKYFLYTPQAKQKNSEVIKKLQAFSENSYEISEKIYNIISDTNTPQGVMCICNTIDKFISLDKMKDEGKYIALEHIQDPSNIGNILRTAEALGVDGVIMSNNCCDIYSPKVVRGSMGAIFRIPFIITDDFVKFLTDSKDCGFKIYSAVPDRKAKSVTEVLFNEGSIIAVGNEGNGLTKETISISESITIFMQGNAESLNVATASSILMWEMLRN